MLELPFLILYYLFFESIFQSTPGKALTNTIVVNDNGQRPRFIQLLGRTFGRLIPFDALSFFGNDARGWHDSLPGTYVVEATDINEQYSQIEKDTLALQKQRDEEQTNPAMQLLRQKIAVRSKECVVQQQQVTRIQDAHDTLEIQRDTYKQDLENAKAKLAACNENSC